MKEESYREACRHAAISLTKFISMPVTADYHGIRMCNPNEIVDALGGDDALIVGLLIGVEGAFRGDLLFSFEPESADRLAVLLTGEPLGNEMSDSALQETTNILASAWLSGLATAEGITLMPTTPAPARDMAAAIVGEVMAKYVEFTPTASIIDAAFTLAGRGMAARVLLISEAVEER